MTLPQTGARPPLVLDSLQAAQLVPDGASVLIEASGGGVLEPGALLAAIGARFRNESAPRGLRIYFCSGVGNRAGSGADYLNYPGLVGRAVAGHWAMTPGLAGAAHRGEIEAYCLPQGVLAQLLRESAAGRPGLVTRVGTGTFVDPRLGGGKLNEATTEDLVEVVHLAGHEYLFYPAPRFDVALIRGTTADENGNLTLENETAKLGVLAAAMAAHNNGGLVIAQVERLANAGTLPARAVDVPGHLVDVLVVEPEQPQTAEAGFQVAFTGGLRAPVPPGRAMPLDERKIVARRALDEIPDGSVINLGVGMADGVATVAAEEGRLDSVRLTVEQGIVGGIPQRGVIFGVVWNPDAILDHSSQFDFYDGGGLDVACLGFAEVDSSGNVNSSMVDGRVIGAGGFINISSAARKLVFCGTLTTGGLRASIQDERLAITREGSHRKFVSRVHQVTFNAALALERGQEVCYVTERAVFRLTSEGLELIEVALGWSAEQIIALMDFTPLVARDLAIMNASLYLPRRISDQNRHNTSKEN